MSGDDAWTRHELQVLIEHHVAVARQMTEFLATIVGDEALSAEFTEFTRLAQLRIDRADELRARLPTIQAT